MNQILLVLHLFGFGGAVSSSVGNIVVMRLIGAAPGDAPVLGKVPPMLASVARGSIGLLWLTGIIMVWSVFGGPGNLPGLFWIKFILVLAVTAAVVMIGLAMKAARNGDTGAAARIPLYGMISSGLLVLIVIFAVWAFANV
ncbi:MAG TPA: hypothetical protein VII91_00825 [Bauldia sp.]